MKNQYSSLFLLFSLLFNLQICFTQRPVQRPDGSVGRSPIKITATIVDKQNDAPLEYATVTLYSMRDSSIVTGGISDTQGKITLDARPGRFFMMIEFISYESEKIENIAIKPESPMIELGTISMSQSTATLEAIEVRAERSEMQMTLDKRVFNVGKDLANKGGTAIDLLDNVPSVSVDIEGNVSLRGSDNVKILIDGKPSALIGLGNTNGLRSIATNMIARIEVITNPSARYEAEGMTGIINIILRKDEKSGINGSFDFTLGFPDNYGIAINLNYRKDKLNVFTNLGVNYRKSPGYGSLYQEFYKNDTTFILNEARDFTRTAPSSNIRIGANYYITDKDILTASISARASNNDNVNSIIYDDYINDFPGHFVNKTIRTNDQKETDLVYSYAFDFNKIFDTKKHNLNVHLQVDDNREFGTADFKEQYFDVENIPTGFEDLLQRSDADETSSRLLIKADYVKPFGKDGKFEVGGQSSFRIILNHYIVEELDDDIWTILEGVSNDFEYTEDIHAIYTSYGNKYGKFSFLAGLRGEYSDVSTLLKQTNETNIRDGISFFPTLHLTYDLAKQNAVQLSYSRRIRRPRFYDLNPFFSYSDARNFYSGNPNLDPQFTHSIEFGHVKYFDKGSMSSSLYYRLTDGYIQRIRRINEDGTTFTRPENLATENAYGAEFTFSVKPAKWVNFNGDLNFYRSIVDGTNQGNTLENDSYSWFGRFTTKFTLLQGTDFQLKFNYRAPRETTQGEREAMAFLDVGISRDILKKKGPLTLSGRDLFNSRKRKYSTFGDNFFSQGEFQWRSRSITLTFNYRLNQKKKRARGGYGGGGGEF